MRHRPSPATVIASVALFFSLGGASAYAARHYLITSIHQISPKVRHQLRGHRGPRGVPGAVTADTYSTGGPVTVTGTSDYTVTTQCSTGRVVTGGFNGTGVIVTESMPNSNKSWEVTAHLDPNWTPPLDSKGNPEPATIAAVAVCG